MNSARSVFSVLLLCGLPAATVAQGVRDSAARGDSNSASTSTLAPVVVTATRIPTAVSLLSQPVIVLSGNELRARGVQTVSEALRSVPGASVVQSGSAGGVTSLFLRGGESRYTKVLIDGTPINSVGGTQFFENLSLDNVDRIEIVYGPSSALYGADAISGVIQIFTRAGSGPAAFDVDARTGTYGSRDATASLRGGVGRADYSVGGGWHQMNGLASFNNTYTNGDLSGMLRLRPDRASEVTFSTRYTGSLYHFPTDYTGAVNDSNSYTREHRLVAGVSATRRISNSVRLQLLAGDNEIHGLSEDTQASGIEGAPFTKTSAPADGYRRYAEARVEGSAGIAGTVTVGAQYQGEEERSSTLTRNYAVHPDEAAPIVTPGSDDHRITRGYYVALQGSPLPALSYDASARHDNHSDFQDVNTYHLGASVVLWSGARLRGSYGTGFNAPPFYATQGSAYNAANRDLQPEQSHSLDVGIVQSLLAGKLHLSAGAFDQRFSEMIQYVAGESSGPPDYTQLTPSFYTNLTKARSKGFQGEVSAELPMGFAGSANYVQTVAQVYAVPPGYMGQQPGDALLRRPSHSGSVKLSYARSSDWSLGASADYIGKRPDRDFSVYPSPTVTLPGYVTLGLSASVRVLQSNGTSVSLTGRVENALNRRYEDVFNFPAAGRTILVGARLSSVR